LKITPFLVNSDKWTKDLRKQKKSNVEPA